MSSKFAKYAHKEAKAHRRQSTNSRGLKARAFFKQASHRWDRRQLTTDLQQQLADVGELLAIPAEPRNTQSIDYLIAGYALHAGAAVAMPRRHRRRHY